MGGLWTFFRRFAPKHRLWRSRSAWAGFAVTAAFLIVACSGGNSDATPTAPAMFDGDGNPIEEPTGINTPDGDIAPDFEIPLFENDNHTRGELLRLSSLRGSPVVVNFWFPSCPPCIAEMPDLEAAFQKYNPEGVEFVGIQLVGLDSVDDGQDFVDLLDVNYALGPDEDTSIVRNYKITGFPTTWFVDENQQVVRKWTGILTEKKLDELVQELLN